MNEFELRPLVGAGPILLGASREDVHRAIGPPQRSFRKSPGSVQATDLWFEGRLQVFHTGADPRVEFVELSAGGAATPVAFGVRVLEVPALEVVECLTKQAHFDAMDPELGFSYVFPALELSLWRPVVDPPEGLTFQTVGIGVRGYYTGGACPFATAVFRRLPDGPSGASVRADLRGRCALPATSVRLA